MSHTLRPRARCIRKALQYSDRSISTSPSRQFPGVEANEELEQDILTTTSTPTSNDDADFLSTRSEIDAYLRAQDNIYLSKVQRNLESLSSTASAINTLLPKLVHQSAQIRPPSTTTTSATSKIGTPTPYIVSAWQRSSYFIPPITTSLLSQITLLQQNISDLQSEPYRSETTLSEREKLDERLANWGEEEKKRELMNAELKSTGMQARFLRRVEGLEEEMRETVEARRRRRGIVEESEADGLNSSYRPFVIAAATTPTTTPTTTGMEIPKTEGWGISATRVEEKRKDHARTSNPFKLMAASSSTKSDIEALRKKLDGGVEGQQNLRTVKKMATSRNEAETAETPAETKTAQEAEESKGEPKVRSLADLQKRMNALQGEKH